MAGVCRHLMQRNGARKLYLPMNNYKHTTGASKQKFLNQNLIRVRQRQSNLGLELNMIFQSLSFHSGKTLFKRSSKTIEEDQLELVNIFSPLGVLLAEGTPIIYLERMCKSFEAYTYKECTYQTKTRAFQNLRNLQFIKNENSNESTMKNGGNRKWQHRETLTSIQDFRTIRKIQADIVNNGECQLTFKSKASGDVSRKVKELEHFAKNILQDLCTFHIIERGSSMAIYKLQRKPEDDEFFKNIFDVIFTREKEEVNMMIDYYKTVKSFSAESKSS